MATLDTILSPVRSELLDTEAELKRQLREASCTEGPRGESFEIADSTIEHFFRTPGKRLRPALVLLAARAVRDVEAPSYQPLVKMATAVELIHSASLIHDDIIDRSATRRARASVNELFGNQIAVLAGDILYAQFFKLLINLETDDAGTHKRVLNLFCETTKRMCMGEMREGSLSDFAGDEQFQSYLLSVEDKTASLFSSACAAGAMLNRGGDEECRALGEYGRLLGITFQLADDVADGDSVVRSPDLLSGSATRHCERSKERLSDLSASSARSSLLALADYVMEPIGIADDPDRQR